MKRIKQLLAKGIDSLDEQERAELFTLLSAEELAKLSDADLAELKGAIAEAANVLLDDEDSSAAVLAALEDLANVLDTVTGEEARRADEKADAEQKKQALRDRIRGEAEGEGDEEESTDESAEGEGEPPAEGEEPPAEESKDEEPVPVTANTVPAAPKRAPIRQTTPVRSNRVTSRQAPITAAAGLPGLTAGMRLDTPDRQFAAWDSAVKLAMNSQSPEFKMPVISTRVEIPEDRQLDRNAELNHAKIERLTSIDALAANAGLPGITASGGACAPVPYRYDLPTVGDDVRPVRDALLRMGAQRGGIALFTPPTIDDVDGTGATTSAVSEWTHANDVTPADPTTKPYLRINCGSDTATTTRVNAIIEQYEAGNMMERWYPELIAAYQKLIGVYHARFADAKLLATIATGSKAVTHATVLGSASDVFVSLDQLITGIRYRHRIVQNMPIRVIGFEWVRTSITTDLIRRGAGDRPLEERLRMANQEVNGFFSARNCNITWSPDFQFGRTIGQAGGPMAGTQGVGSVIGLPSVARFYVFLEGSWIFVDGGQFNAGVMRDVTKIRTNDWVYFSESFENAVYHNVPGESYVYDIDICANGGYSSALDIDPCQENS